MSKESLQGKQLDSNNAEEKPDVKHKPWNYPDSSTDLYQNQNRTCCSPADEIEAMVRENLNIKVI